MYWLREGCDSWGDLCWEQQRVAAAGLTAVGQLRWRGRAWTTAVPSGLLHWFLVECHWFLLCLYVACCELQHLKACVMGSWGQVCSRDGARSSS